MRTINQNKALILLTLLFLVAPLLANAWALEPTINLTIVVNTEGQDADFNFKVKRLVTDWCYYNEQDQEVCGDIFVDTGDFTVQTSGLTASYNIPYFYPTGVVKIIQETPKNLTLENISCNSDSPENEFYYIDGGIKITSKPWTSVVCIFNNKKIDTKRPVLIVPGIMGTEIKDGDKLLWADLDKMFTDVGDIFMDTMSFNEMLNSNNTNIKPGNVIKRLKMALGLGSFDYTAGLIDELKSQDYLENQNLFLFPYDWRYGVSGKYADGKTNVDLLKQKIDDILQQTGTDKINIIAHSNGGLLVKKYVIDNPQDYKIDKAVFVGVPNTGAPKAVKFLLQGDNMNIPFLNESEMKKISKNMPVAYDLLPSQKYYDVNKSFVQVIQEGNIFDPFSTTIPNSTITNLNYQETKSFLTNDHTLNSQALLNSENLHNQNYDDYDLRTAGINLFNITGCKQATLSKIIEKRSFDIFGRKTTAYLSPKMSAGDGTVTFESAINLPINQENLYYALNSDHGKMPSQNGIKEQITNIITGSNLAINEKIITQDISKCQLNGKMISIFSPIDIFVIDQLGNRLGLAEDKSIINEIAGADFEIWGEHKFLFLPTDEGQIYTINLTGTELGTYTIKVQDIKNTQTTKTEVFSNLPVTKDLTGKIILENNEDTTNLVIKENAEALTKNVLPDSNLMGSKEDYLPPFSYIKINNDTKDNNYEFYNNSVNIKIIAQDLLEQNVDSTQTGVMNIWYSLDDSKFQKVMGSEVNFTVEGQGKHKIQFFSTDKMGNNEQTRIAEFTIDKTPPEIVIEFDPVTKDLKFIGKDDVSLPSEIIIIDKDDIVTAVDRAGNKTEIKLKDKDRKRRMKAEIESIKYNDKEADINKNKMFLTWIYNRQDYLLALTQHIVSKKDYNMLAIYNGKNTILVGKDISGRILETIKGLKIIKITTNNGDLIWGY